MKISMQTEIKSVISLYSNGQIQEALDSVGALIKDYPNEPLLYNISGICYKAIGQRDAAVKSFENALAIKQDFADAHNNLGVTLQELGQLEAAVKHYEEALAIRPDYAEAHNNFGVTLQELGQLEAAVKHYEEALAIRPDYAEAHNNLGITLKELGQLDAAVESYKKTIVIKPNFAEAHNNLGITLKELGQLDTAVKSYEKALAIKPNFAEAHNNLGNVFKDLGQLDTAVKSYEKALAIRPDYAEVHNNLGNALKELGQLDAAFNCYEKTLAIKPEFAEANYNRGNVLKGLKRLDEALASYERAYILKPDIDFLLGDLLHTKMHLCIWDDLPSQLDEFKNKINNSEKVIHPFPVLALIDDPEVQRKTAEIFANEKYSQSHLLSKIERYPKHKKIRIGYFSADFRDHPVSHLTAELYEIHDRNQFEIYAFSFGPDTQDEMNLRIKAGVDHFHDVRSMSHKEVVMLARSLEIDIAVDLTGFTKNARTEIFAMSVAPIQISYIGYLGTMGANYYDYLVADPTIIPEKNQKYFSEKIAYLPSYQVNDSTQSPPEIFFTRQDLGLPETGFVFCCFNNTFKITPTTFDSWGRILEHVEGSILLIYVDNESAKLNLTKEIVLRGIDPSRLIFGEKLPIPEYLARYRVADLFLDTHPYNAGTTSSDALRMGLPVLTLKGNSFNSRMAASVINAVNLPELITSTQKEYESLAIELATHPEQLKIIKEKLIKNLPTAPLYDTPLFTQHLESAYRTMYDRYHQRLELDHIYMERYK
uniref:protein O-GlcNAc transferase n=1 Tax=uncultured marine bacterium 560 TaxID=257395 RepID=Q6SGE6_9BACT|nr:TPR domain protein [uncultured marine bacterium 560]